jgi:hypothetical protein
MLMRAGGAVRMEMAQLVQIRPASHFVKLKDGERQSRTSPKREVNFDRRRWKHHKSVWRHFRHILTIPNSSVLQRLMFPDLFVVMCSSGAVTYYNSVSSTPFSLPPLPFTLCSLAVGLLTTFRFVLSSSCFQFIDILFESSSIFAHV